MDGIGKKVRIEAAKQYVVKVLKAYKRRPAADGGNDARKGMLGKIWRPSPTKRKAPTAKRMRSSRNGKAATHGDRKAERPIEVRDV